VGQEIIEPLIDRLVGRTLFEAIQDPKTGETLVEAGTVVSEDQAKMAVASGVEEATIRSAITCNTKHGVCKECDGRNVATGDEVEVGEAVGIIAAQSIGEPGTQDQKSTRLNSSHVSITYAVCCMKKNIKH